jgi:hypothetical protein
MGPAFTSSHMHGASFTAEAGGGGAYSGDTGGGGSALAPGLLYAAHAAQAPSYAAAQCYSSSNPLLGPPALSPDLLSSAKPRPTCAACKVLKVRCDRGRPCARYVHTP